MCGCVLLSAHSRRPQPTVVCVCVCVCVFGATSLFLVSNACGSETLHTDFFDLEVFEYLHMLLFITVAIFLMTVLFLIVGGLLVLKCAESIVNDAADRVKKLKIEATSESSVHDDDEPPRPPPRKGKYGTNAAPRTENSALLADLEAKLAPRDNTGETLQLEEPKASMPRPSLFDFLPLCCGGKQFHVSRMVRRQRQFFGFLSTLLVREMQLRVVLLSLNRQSLRTI